MKLCFSTIGCPDWSWDEIFATVKDMGFPGVEVRGIGDELFIPNARPFIDKHIAITTAQLRRSGVEIPMLTSGICLATDSEEAVMHDAAAYIDLAQKLGTPYIRLMPTSKPQAEGPIDEEMVADRYEKICAYGAERGVAPLIETNGVFCDTGYFARFLNKIQAENKGVLWDIHHPYRYHGEMPEETMRNIGGLIRYVHVKDSRMENGDVKYRMMGYGDVPVEDAVRRLSAAGYNGYLSLEWVKRWNRDLEDGGVVFAHYKGYMDHLLQKI